MNNKFQEMMETMMENMMAQMMQKTMEKMMSQMMGAPEVAPAEVVASKPQTLSREDFLALEESKPTTAVVPSEPIDLVVDSTSSRTLVFNQSVSGDIWTANWVAMKKSFPNVKYDSKTKGFHWNAKDTNEFRVACQSFKVITTLTDADREAVKQYRREKNQRMAEFYAKKAEQ